MYIYFKSNSIEDYFLYFLFRKGLQQFWDKCPLWKHLSQELVYFCTVSTVFISYFENFGFWDQAFFFYFFQEYVSCGKHFQDFSCCILLSSFLLMGWFPNTRKGYFIFLNFASRLERWQFLLESKRLYRICWYCKVVLNANFIEYLYCATLCRIVLLRCHCSYVQKNYLFELLMI